MSQRPHRYALNQRIQKITLLELVTLVSNVYRGADSIGFEDSNNTLTSFTRRLERKTPVPEKLIESALWSCNLLDERGEFWHPTGKSFDEFVTHMLGDRTFDKLRNYINEE